MKNKYIIDVVISISCLALLITFYVWAKPVLDSKASNTDLIPTASAINKIVYQETLDLALPWTVTKATLIEANQQGVLLQVDFNYSDSNAVPAKEIKLSASLRGQNTYGQSFSVDSGSNSAAMLFSIMDKNNPLILPINVDLQLSFDHIKDNRYRGRVGDIKKITFEVPSNTQEAK